MSKEAQYHIFGDGSCTGVGVGAWAGMVISANGTYKKVLYGLIRETTISRCELLPIIECLNHIKRRLKTQGLSYHGVRVSVVSDSEYTVKAMGALNLDAVKSNRDLWYGYATAAEGLVVDPVWVARNSHPFMRYSDSLCYGMRKHALETIEKACASAPVPTCKPKLEKVE